jgi:aspartate aminotransferase-like enzyme
VVARIKEVKPAVLFLPHVETSAGIIVSHDYIKAVAEAVHAGDPDAIVVLDCIASGNCWTNMSELGVDCLITAPQKGW